MAIRRASERAFLFLRQKFRAIARDFPFWRAQVFILLQNSADLVAKRITVIDYQSKRASKLPLEKIPKNRPITIFEPRKVISSPKMEIGCVKMEGQKISIKILSSKLLKPQNIWCYQYQVSSNKSPYRGLVDQIFSSISFDTNKS